MKGPTETLMKFRGFAGWKWEDDFRAAISAFRPDADEEVLRRIRVSILRDFVDFVLEVVNQELRLGLQVVVEGVGEEGIVGTMDFEDRRRDLAAVERRIAKWGPVPRPCRSGPIMDRLLACTELVMSPYRLEFGELRPLPERRLALAGRSVRRSRRKPERPVLACAPAGLTIGPVQEATRSRATVAAVPKGGESITNAAGFAPAQP